MSLQSAIPRRFALQHCPPPLYRPVSIFKPPEVFCQPVPSANIKTGLEGPDKAKYQRQGWAKSEYRSGPDRNIKLTCNLSKSDWDPNRDPIVYSRSGSLTVEQRGELLSRAKKYVRGRNSSRDEVFRKQIEVLMPFVDVQSESTDCGFY
jgi:hypothetical protein